MHSIYICTDRHRGRHRERERRTHKFHCDKPHAVKTMTHLLPSRSLYRGYMCVHAYILTYMYLLYADTLVVCVCVLVVFIMRLKNIDCVSSFSTGCQFFHTLFVCVCLHVFAIMCSLFIIQLRVKQC